MVDFATEQVISPQRLAKKLGLSTETIRRWFRQGLESRKLMGKRFTSLEALNRFSPEPKAAAVSSEVSESMESLSRMGVNVGRESCRDERKSAKKANAEVHRV